ncbi:uncharacterized protein LOC110269046 [Arachis ipaensis]|nr:uncharacterized protein LOC110269046 [Arachis ipaensis]XP_020971978.1 uncharacterized protein LOC110269046 [Arachis ipaensis]QHO25200.1 uncharacterized protein DS421_12g378980 [Arachis hypogaea]QHO25201.1 uncharacterized protein DS421_12g378980 [Arachis hypogaea]
MEIFPESVLSLWNKCEIRVLVLLSLLWQVILIICGPMRKHKRSGIKGLILNFVVWVTYLTADQLATVALGTLATNQIEVDKSNSKRESKDQSVQALWAPFLLLHLGGPDTITAYSLEDNTLWRRHLLGLIVQVSVAFYIFLRSWGNNALTFVAIPMFVSGIIKYSERNWVLRSATTDQFRKSLPSNVTLQIPNSDHILRDPELECIHKGYSLFPLVKRLYANLGVEDQDLTTSFNLAKECVLEMKPPSAFKVVQVQLGFLFDVLYTKASIIYTKKGLFLRLVSALSTTCAVVAFILVIHGDDAYSRVDVDITYVLFIGAIFLELYAFFAITLSDWTMCWLTKRERSCLLNLMYSFISRFRSILSGSKDKLYMSQLSLMDLCLKETTTSCIEDYLFNKILPLEFNLLRNERLEEVDTDMKKLIFNNILYSNHRFERNSLAINVIYWHVVTEIVYHSTSPSPGEEGKRKREACKKISDYLFYILLQHPSMLPPWIGGIEYIQDTINHARELCHHAESPAQAAQILKQYVNTNRDGVKSRKSFLDGSYGIFENMDQLHGVWLDILTSATDNFEWGSHAQQLPSGGEFLTHVSLLKMDHFLSQILSKKQTSETEVRTRDGQDA